MYIVFARWAWVNQITRPSTRPWQSNWKAFIYIICDSCICINARNINTYILYKFVHFIFFRHIVCSRFNSFRAVSPSTSPLPLYTYSTAQARYLPNGMIVVCIYRTNDMSWIQYPPTNTHSLLFSLFPPFFFRLYSLLLGSRPAGADIQQRNRILDKKKRKESERDYIVAVIVSVNIDVEPRRINRLPVSIYV